MADYAVTAALTTPGAGATIDNSRNAGAVIAAGQAVYLDLVTNTYKLAIATAAVTSKVAGIALNSALVIGAPVAVLTAGLLNATATFVARSPVVLSGAVAGNMAPAADLITNIATWYPCVVLIPYTATTHLVQPMATLI